MSLLNWILGKKEIAAVNANSGMAHDLFVETTPPSTETYVSGAEDAVVNNAKKENRAMQRPTAVHDFLGKNYWQTGFDHAVQFPTNDRKQSAITRIRADYRQALQQAEQLLFSEKESHEQEVLRMAGISDVLDAQLQRRKRELESLLSKITQQLELSVDDEGWVAPVLAAYNDGFVVGAMEYMRINDLLGGLTGLK